MIYLLTILSLINNFLLLKYNLHIFQQNYYMPDTQIKWLFKNFKKFLLFLLINLTLIYLILLNRDIALIIILLLLLVNIYLSIEKNVIKKLVFTARIKRMYISNYLIMLILYLIFQDNIINLITIFIINSSSTVYMILLNYLNKPINKLIDLYYINDAKKTLTKMPNLKIIAITGSYGKTSMKNYIGQLLSSHYNTLITPGNFNTRLGITRTIREYLKPTHEIFICEIGIDRVGQIEKTIKLINPDYCVITAIGPQHLETFKTEENIVNSKMKLATSLKENGIAFLNLDNELINSYPLIKDRVIGYGIHNNLNNKLKIDNINYSAKGLNFNLIKDKIKYEITSNLLGEHNLINLYGAITVADYFGVPIKNIVSEIKKIKSVEHRLSLIPGTDLSLIDDSYNSNPIGAKNALKVLKEFEGTRILITPGMVELGAKQEEYNYDFGLLAAECSDYIYLINEKQTESIHKALKAANYDTLKIKVCKTFDGAIEDAKSLKTNNHKYILIENDLPDSYN